MTHSSPVVSTRRDVRLSPTTIQEMLDENVRLIHSLMAHQRCGAVREASELQQVLHRNLIYLATIADSAAAHAATNNHQNPQSSSSSNPSAINSAPNSAVNHSSGSQPATMYTNVPHTTTTNLAPAPGLTSGQVAEKCPMNNYPPTMLNPSGLVATSEQYPGGSPALTPAPQHYHQPNPLVLPNGAQHKENEHQ
ncbi:unnamed protein product [Dicrocoelium dendriticum]|nr:unnamed protein product [Dicrocoelium dendriticum]